MELDIIGLLGACSYALDCVEAELTHVATKHGKRVAYMSVCTAQKGNYRRCPAGSRGVFAAARQCADAVYL